MSNTTTDSGFRKTMSPLHTWTGLVVGWILYFVFVTGTLGYFDTEIDSWATPELPKQEVSLETAVLTAETWLTENVPTADSWYIAIPSTRDYPNLRVSWNYQEPPEGEDRNGRVFLNPETATPYTIRDTGGGQALYRMHYDLHYMPGIIARYIVGIASMFMLVAIITGIIIHKKIFADFFTFRPRKGQRSWLDMHNMLGVLALPFHLMITYSGLLFFAFLYMPAIIVATYGIGPEAEENFVEDLIPHSHLERAGEAAPLAPLLPMVQQAQEQLGAGQVISVAVEFPNDANAKVTINPPHNSIMMRVEGDGVSFNGVTGEHFDYEYHAAELKTPVKLFFAMLGLHEGYFADISLRWLYFLSGVMGSIMIATGLILWSVKRHSQLAKQNRPLGRGHRLVEILNIGTIVGLMVGIAAFFWANRLLPVDLVDRAEWEIHVLFITWLLMLAHAALRPAKRAWTESLWIAAAAFGLLPLLNILTTERGLISSVMAGDWVFASFDLCALVCGLLFALAAWWRQRRDAKPAPIAAPSAVVSA